MGVAQDLRTFLLADGNISTLVGARIHRNIAPEDYAGTYIWYRLSTTRTEETLSAAVEQSEAVPFYVSFDVEMISLDIDHIDALATILRAKHNYIGSFGGGTCQAIRVVDQGEDYEPRGIPETNMGLHIAALQFRIDGYEPGE